MNTKSDNSWLFSIILIIILGLIIGKKATINGKSYTFNINGICTNC
ncbi:MAG: hypothetical protein IKQ35_06250 [Bacilli bacterium]|nr:hypothetical protein [Bacilli bacterium]